MKEAPPEYDKKGRNKERKELKFKRQKNKRFMKLIFIHSIVAPQTLQNFAVPRFSDPHRIQKIFSEVGLSASFFCAAVEEDNDSVFCFFKIS